MIPMGHFVYFAGKIKQNSKHLQYLTKTKTDYKFSYYAFEYHLKGNGSQKP